ncbi:hypothetical protein BJX61DRAFT_548133 [Aspergillus egyptiacus]|nr:hypothetical protein BJX61DRAFT_548133 [Aspergillus egyptiacus]
MVGLQLPPIGRRLMADVIDGLAQTDPERRVCSMPKSPRDPDDYVDLPVSKLAHAVNYMASWIEKRFGKGDSFRETIAYIGANDVRYLVMVVACNKTGYKPLLSSTRNSQAAHVRLFEMTDCSKLCYSSEKQQNADDICAAASHISSVEIPSFVEMLAQETSVYPFSWPFEDIKNKVAFIAHSSGTTGFPKPIQLTFAYFGALDHGAYVPIPPGRVAGVPDRLTPDDLILSTTPFFHLMGFSLLIMAVFHGIPCVMLPDKPLSTDLVANVLSITRPTAALFPPSILEDLCAVPASRDALAQLKRVYFGGGPLSPDVGRQVSEFTQLVSFLGMTEGGFVLSLRPEKNEDWSYFEWSPTFGIKMEHVEGGLHEMVIHRNETPEWQPIFHTFPELDCYHTKDLYMAHPERPNLWKFHGRLDDVIVLNNGEKFNPVSMEKIIEGHPLVSRAVVVGLGRFQTALLVEPNWRQLDTNSSSVKEVNLIDSIWPTVQEANRISPAHGHVLKNKIALALRDKPFSTTPKGSTQRRLVADSYKEEIDELYSRPGVAELPFALPPSPDMPTILDFVRKLVLHVSGLSSCADDADLYNVGLDSLRTIQLASSLKAAGFQDISPQMVYYTADLPQQDHVKAMCEGSHSLTVALTGSSGSLGSYLLDSLRSDPSVSKIYCLTRDGRPETQAQALKNRGLDPSIPDKVELVQTSLGEHRLGIPEAKYIEMLQSVNAIIHNAWRMDFNIPVESFEPVHIRAVRSLVDLCAQSSHRAHLHFFSSIGAVGGWSTSALSSTTGPVSAGLVPELPFDDCDVTLRQGYSEAKHICERICLAASERSGVPTSVHRVGQIAGPASRSGYWNRQEWLPALVATSKAMGKVPSSLGAFAVDWVPVDLLSKMILEIVHARPKAQLQKPFDVFHLVNPTATSWESLVPPIHAAYASSGGLETVSMQSWIAHLEQIKSPTEEELSRKPALKLLPFYQSLIADNGPAALSVPLDVHNTQATSAEMRALPAISPEMMATWLEQWQF